ncbi:MAG: DUF1963 domain-containing protein [Candidatus Sericytochromatia bacterium]
MTETDELDPELKKRLEEAGLAKKTWVPITQKSDGSLTSSKFSGKPYLDKSEAWPTCKLCHAPLQLFVQLALNELPEEKRIFGSGLLQLFLCKEPACLSSNASFDVFPPHQCLRIIEPSEAKEDILLPPKHFPAQAITGWTYVGLEYPYLVSQFTDPENSPIYIEEESDEFYMIDGNLDAINQGEKIGGQPFFVQYEREPECPTCKKPLEVLMQIGSRDNIPFDFGDAGVGHIFVCPEHQQNIYFIWDCC